MLHKIKNILEELGFQEAKYTKTSLKKDILADKILGKDYNEYKDGIIDGTKNTFVPVKLTDKANSYFENGVLYLGTLMMSRGNIDTATDASGATFTLRLGGVDSVVLKIKS